MRRGAIRAALMIVTGTVVLAGVVTPASADTGSERYERGNAPAAIDITKLSVHNATARFTMRVAVRDLTERGRFTFHYWSGTSQTPPPRSLLIEVRRVDGDTRARFFGCGREDCVVDTCPSLHAEWHPATDRVEVSASQRCYPRRDPNADPPDVGRFFAWSETRTAEDAGSRPFQLSRG